MQFPNQHFFIESPAFFDAAQQFINEFDYSDGRSPRAFSEILAERGNITKLAFGDPVPSANDWTVWTITYRGESEFGTDQHTETSIIEGDIHFTASGPDEHGQRLIRRPLIPSTPKIVQIGA